MQIPHGADLYAAIVVTLAILAIWGSFAAAVLIALWR
jgi:hypothetical protein